MKSFLEKSILMILIIAGIVAIALGCKKEEVPPTVEILSPTNNSTISNAAAVSISVKFTAEEELEESTVSLKLDSIGAANISPFPLEVHEHVATKTISETVNLSSYPSGTRFVIHAETCSDHNCTDKVTATSYFILP